jgi:hypothetical protein
LRCNAAQVPPVLTASTISRWHNLLYMRHCWTSSIALHHTNGIYFELQTNTLILILLPNDQFSGFLTI